MRIIKDVNIILEDKTVFGNLILEKNKIKDIVVKSTFKKGRAIVSPGFIDVHIHGGCSFDAMDATIEANEGFARCLVKEGTTSFLATTMTQSDENIIKALKAVGSYYQNQNPQASRLLGIHLEGPYISKKAAGAQPLEYIKPPTVDEFISWNKESGNIIKKVSLAPEHDENYALIKYLSQNNIIPSIAHTVAKYQTVKEAILAGASSLTHTYNAMTPLHHRDIGVVGAGFIHPELSSELIFDKIHVSVEAAQILIKNKTYKNVILITDSMRNKGLPEGISELGGQTVYIKNNEARLKDGTLAGSILKMNDGFRNLVVDLKLPLYKASHIASLNAAKQLKIEHLFGSIKAGKIADLVILDENYNVIETIINGNTVYLNK